MCYCNLHERHHLTTPWERIDVLFFVKCSLLCIYNYQCAYSTRSTYDQPDHRFINGTEASDGKYPDASKWPRRWELFSAKESCFDASFLISFSVGCPAAAFAGGCNIMPPHKSLRWHYLKWLFIRLSMETNAMLLTQVQLLYSYSPKLMEFMMRNINRQWQLFLFYLLFTFNITNLLE